MSCSDRHTSFLQHLAQNVTEASAPSAAAPRVPTKPADRSTRASLGHRRGCRRHYGHRPSRVGGGMARGEGCCCGTGCPRRSHRKSGQWQLADYPHAGAACGAVMEVSQIDPPVRS
jgi:hypothetical protein